MEDLLRELQSINIKEAKENLFLGLKVNALCYNIYDTDTIRILFKFNDEYVKLRCRLDRIDAPEKKSKVKEEREMCLKGTEYLKSIILNKIITVNLGKFDKYGRTLSEVFIEEENVNDKLLAGGWVRPYSGGKKEVWGEEELDT